MTEGKWNCGDRIVRFERDGRAAVGRMAGDALVELLDDRGAAAIKAGAKSRRFPGRGFGS